jgi:hypothetical protein
MRRGGRIADETKSQQRRGAENPPKFHLNIPSPVFVYPWRHYQRIRRPANKWVLIFHLCIGFIDEYYARLDHNFVSLGLAALTRVG